MSKKKTIEDIIKVLEVKSCGTVFLSKNYSNQYDLLRFECECGNIFERNWMDLNRHTYAVCPKCAIKYRGINQRQKWGSVLSTLYSAGLTPLTNEYTGNNNYMECVDMEGYKGFVTYNGVKQGKSMSRFDIRVNRKYYIYNVNHWATLNGIEARAIDFSTKNKWTRQGIKCICGCGNEFETSISSFMSGKNRCDICSGSISSYEYIVKKWLLDNSIEFVSQYTFPDCKRTLVLPFDFYLPHKNILIEIDGQGHFYPAYFHNCSKERAEKAFALIKESDEIKDNYCKSNGVTLIRIPYWKIENAEYIKILTNIIKG